MEVSLQNCIIWRQSYICHDKRCIHEVKIIYLHLLVEMNCYFAIMNNRKKVLYSLYGAYLLYKTVLCVIVLRKTKTKNKKQNKKQKRKICLYVVSPLVAEITYPSIDLGVVLNVCARP